MLFPLFVTLWLFAEGLLSYLICSLSCFFSVYLVLSSIVVALLGKKELVDWLAFDFLCSGFRSPLVRFLCFII